jgi:hypothetical protein
MSSAYGGYVSAAARDSKIAWGIPQGSRALMESKFHAQGHVPRLSDAALSSTCASVYDATHHNVAPDNFVKPASRASVTLMPMEKAFVTVPETAAVYTDYLGEVRTLRSIDVAAVEEAFAAVSQGQGFVLPSETRVVLRAALRGSAVEPTTHTCSVIEGFLTRTGLAKIPLPLFLETLADATEWMEKDLLGERPENMKAFRDQSRTRLVNPYVESKKQEDERRAVAAARADLARMRATMAQQQQEQPEDAAYDALAQSAERRRILTAGPAGVVEEGPRAPGLMVGAMREVQLNGEAERRGMPPPIPHPGPNTQANFRLQGPHVLSSYDRDEGQYGEDPRLRPVRDSDIAGFHMTTRELAAGTTRVSQRPPGYMGFVPAFAQGDAEQGLGKTGRDTELAHTNLTATYQRRVPGYSGFLPTYALAPSGSTAIINKQRGAEGKTIYDRSCGAIESYWASVQS